MVKVALIVLVVICILSAMLFIYKWYALYTKYKRIDLKDILNDGKYRPQYINPNNSRFSEEQTRYLNRRFVLIFLSMGIGVLVVIFFKLMGY